MRISLLLGLLLLNSCTLGRDASTEQPVRQYLALAVELGARDPDSLDYYYGPADLGAAREHPSPLREIKQSALELIGRLQSRSIPQPSDSFLVNQLRAISARVDLLMGVHRSFNEEAQVFFGIKPPDGENPARRDQIQAEIARLLPGSAPLAKRYAAFDEEFIIPAERLHAVVDRAMQACRERTTAHVTLPAGEHVGIEYVSNKPWSAFSYYLGNFQSRIEINTDLPLTVDRALELACHEGYPGHHVYNSLQEAELIRSGARKELAVQLTFSPQSFVSEAVANVAGELAFSDDTRLAFERDQLFPLAGFEKHSAEQYLRVERLVDELQEYQVPIARDYLDGKLEFVRAAAALERDVLMVHSEATLKYLNEYRTYMLTYTLGKKLAMQCLIGNSATAGSPDSWVRFEKIIRSQPALGECAADAGTRRR